MTTELQLPGIGADLIEAARLADQVSLPQTASVAWVEIRRAAIRRIANQLRGLFERRDVAEAVKAELERAAYALEAIANGQSSVLTARGENAVTIEERMRARAFSELSYATPVNFWLYETLRRTAPLLRIPAAESPLTHLVSAFDALEAAECAPNL